jgi:hypothetical protein
MKFIKNVCNSHATTNNIQLDHMPGKIMPADPLTKVKDVDTFQDFRSIVLGHQLLSSDDNKELT